MATMAAGAGLAGSLSSSAQGVASDRGGGGDPLPAAS
jgi:hypothetical protein